ncbi:MAG: hypothetical protein Q9191_008570, partial [Dirinaria sp. TL-2023a]
MARNKDQNQQGSAFDFSLTFMGETLSYKKNQVVSVAKEVGKEIKDGAAGAAAAAGSKAVGGGP